MRRKFSVIFSVLAIFMRCTVNGQEPERKENSFIPRDLIPLEYTLLFEIDMADERNLFTGTATIMIQCIQRTNKIILNVKDLEIDRETVKVTEVPVRKSRSCLRIIPMPQGCFFLGKTSSTETMKPVIYYQYLDEDKERYNIVLNNELKENEVVTVIIKYRKLSSLQYPDMAFIKYSYRKESNDEEKWLAVTRSGAINARKLYPCIDERNLRAPITVMISHHKDLISLSNTLLEKDGTSLSKELPDFVVEKYQPTNGLSTFSIGLVVGNLVINPTPNKSQNKSSYKSPYELLINEVRIWVDKSVLGQEAYNYATVNAQLISNYYHRYFEISHSGRRIDIVALPNHGYIDKWKLDLITLDESVITNSDPSNTMRNVEIVFQLCDIFSHQYFGPQTTSKWSEHWLNMGLALFFRAPCFDNILPQEASGLVIINQTESFIRISDADPRRIFHPLTLSNSQINLNTLFEDSALANIAYSLVRMLNSIVSETEDVLYEGVKEYIAKSKTKDFNLEDIVSLFQQKKYIYSLPKKSTLQTVMDSWTSTNAFAIIKLTRAEGERLVKVTQEPLDEDEYGNKIYKYIPLIYSTKTDLSVGYSHKRRVRMWLKHKPYEITHIYAQDWVIHNSKLDVLCRYVYDGSILKLIEDTLSGRREYTTIPHLARAQLISDLFAIAEMKEYPDYTYSMVFKILKYLKHESYLPPLMVALHEFNKIRLRLLGSEAFHLFQDYVQHILQIIIDDGHYKNITKFDQTDYLEYHLKRLIVTSACTYQLKTCVDQSTALFKKWQVVESSTVSEVATEGESKGKSQINSPFPEIVRPYTYCQAIRKGGEHEWNFLWKFYDKKNAGKSDDILNALACTEDRKQLKEYLEWSIQADKIAVEDSSTVFKSVGTNVLGYALMYEFLKDNFEEISAVHEDNLSNAYAYWKLLYEITWNRNDFVKLETFTNSGTSSAQKMNTHLQESKKKAEKNILWLENNGEGISSFLKSWKEQHKKT